MPSNDATSTYTPRRTIQPAGWYTKTPVIGLFTQPRIPTGAEVHSDFIAHFPGYVHDVPQQPLAGIIDNHSGSGVDAAITKALPPEPIVFSGDATALQGQAQDIVTARRDENGRQALNGATTAAVVGGVGAACLYGSAVAGGSTLAAIGVTGTLLSCTGVGLVVVAAVLVVFAICKLFSWW